MEELVNEFKQKKLSSKQFVKKHGKILEKLNSGLKI